MARVKRIGLRVSDSEYECISAGAKTAGIPIATYAKQAVLAGRAVDKNALHDIRVAINKAGININQIARHCNAGGAAHDMVLKMQVILNDLKAVYIQLRGVEECKSK